VPPSEEGNIIFADMLRRFRKHSGITRLETFRPARWCATPKRRDRKAD
jgi:hypothetical protein